MFPNRSSQTVTEFLIESLNNCAHGLRTVTDACFEESYFSNWLLPHYLRLPQSFSFLFCMLKTSQGQGSGFVFSSLAVFTSYWYCVVLFCNLAWLTPLTMLRWPPRCHFIYIFYIFAFLLFSFLSSPSASFLRQGFYV